MEAFADETGLLLGSNWTGGRRGRFPLPVLIYCKNYSVSEDMH